MDFISEAQLASMPDPRWIIEGVLPENSFVVLFGAPGAGKTFISLSMAMSIATGSDWLERSTQEANVVYVAAEGLFGLKTRVAAFHRHNTTSPGSNIRFVKDPLPLLSPTAISSAAGHIGKCRLIVIDTLARCIVGGDENSAKDMGVAVASIDLLRKESGASILVLHHSVKNGPTERGSSALRGAADVMISCAGDDSRLVFLKCEKMKDAEPFKEFSVELAPVEVAPGRSSLVPVPSFMSINSVAAARNENARLAKQLLNEAGAQGLAHSDWRDEFRSRFQKSTSTFNRALKHLAIGTDYEKSGTGQGARYVATSVSVSPKCQTGVVTQPPATGVSITPLRGDTGTGLAMEKPNS